ncbi:DUF4080 domain-containing protein [Alkalibaculum sp. M08DMB]|uniref:DUF4080 domain-containing protein n=1 Tax=Alkalibaculum sporogenes TaxID=2655001 RepID=A0A6A7K8C6_9FIRM|nr:B12-binding domain-containing radical SAM protein [Alkalibaculum sporogenes]MPW25684.1 DUF4080 domain-containing protein [Alkalibaculum sporogenes]
MKVILTTLNSKYIHTNLALRTLKANSPKDLPIELVEYTINDHLDDILGSLYNLKGEVYAFSCYIWNIEQTLKIVNNLKVVLPHCTIILGGPEVSFDGDKTLQICSADIIVKGEGESIFRDLLVHLNNQTEYKNLSGIVYRDNNNILETQNSTPIKNMDNLNFAYQDEDMSKYQNQILYYEGSRGCPFSCSYCLSSVEKGVRNHSIERIQRDLLFFIKNNVKQVKFVDRTFNANLNWSKAIIKFLIENTNYLTNFHFEIAADLLDEEIIQLLNIAPIGLFQLEIGVQSVNNETLTTISRKTNIDKIEKNVKKLLEKQNIHVHLDLIAGLPYENFSSFEISFNRVYSMNPHMLQLGFLKLLKGSPITIEKDKYSYKHTPYAPYEILSNKYISYEELLYLKNVEQLVDKYYNTRAFQKTINYIINHHYSNPFQFFKDLIQFFEKNNLFNQSHNKDKFYSIIMNFITQQQYLDSELIKDLIKLDYLSYNKLSLPTFIKSTGPHKEKVFEMLKDQAFKENYLPHFSQEPAKKIYKQIHAENFKYNLTDMQNIKKETTLLLFYKSDKQHLDHTNEYVEIPFSVEDLF